MQILLRFSQGAHLLSVKVNNAARLSAGRASLAVHTSSVPRGGGLQILLSPSQTPLAGYNGEVVAGRDSFLIIAKDWVSAQDRTLEYEFRYIQVPAHKHTVQPCLRLSASGFCFLPHHKSTMKAL